MGTHRRNAALAARISELGLTEREVGDVLNESIREATGTPGRCTDRYVRLLIDGQIRWPWPSRRAALEQVFGRPILELGFIPRSSNGTGFAPRLPPASTAAPQPRSAADLVAVIRGRPLSVEVPPLPAVRLTDTDLDRLSRPLADLYALYAIYGPVGLPPIAARHGTRLAKLRVEMSGRFGRRLHALIADYWAAAAWFALAMDDPTGTDLYLQRALWAAATTTDPLVMAHITHVMATRAEHLAAHDEAAALAGAATHSPAARTDGRARAVGYFHLALAQALRGSLPRAEQSLDRARETLRQAGGEPAQPWLTGIDDATVDTFRARAALSIGQYDIAAKYAQQAADGIEPGRVWDRTMIQLDLADAYLGMREVEQAAERADVALDLAGQLNDALRAGQVAIRLRRLAGRLAEWHDVRPATQWISRYRQMAGIGETRSHQPRTTNTARGAATPVHAASKGR